MSGKRYTLDEFNRIPSTLPVAADDDAMRIVSLDDFVKVDEAGAEAILGSATGAVIPEGGAAMFYGDGGVGKTTLAIDLVFHLAAGDDWLGIPVGRCFRVLVVENEGPRPLYRRKLQRKRDAWTGSPVGERIRVLEHPWAKFSFADDSCRRLLAEHVREHETDLVVAGPVTSIGMDTAGTVQEVRAFDDLLGRVRDLAGRPLAFLLVHHENKGGKVSGAWEGVGDTLMHVQQQGHGHVRVYVQKARWASEQHATTLQLDWAAGDGFQLADAEPARPERVWDDIAAYVLAHGGCSWSPLEKAVPGNGDYLRQRRDQMLADGVLLNTGKGGKGNPLALWHRDDPARPTLDMTVSEVGRGSDAPVSATGDEAETETVSPRPLRSRDAVRDTVGSASPDTTKNDAGRSTT